MSAVIGALRADLSASVAQFASDLGKAADELGKFADKAKSVARDVGKLGQEMSLEFTAEIVAFGVEATKSAVEVNEAAAQITAALASMGNRSGKSLQGLREDAEALAKNSLFDSTNILAGVTSRMLAFGNISGKVFDQAQQAALDLATRMKMDLPSAAELVGKSLNDPINGVKALNKAGVQFTAAQQKQVVSMVQSGHGLQAQQVLLQRLQQAYGGAAEAAEKASPTAALTHAWSDLKEVVGTITIDYLPPLVTLLTDLATAFKNLTPNVQKGVVAFAAIAATVGPILVLTATVLRAAATIKEVFGKGGLFGEAVEVVAELGAALGALGGLLLPIVAVIAGIGAAIYVFRNLFIDAFTALTDFFKNTVGKDWADAANALSKLFSDLSTGPVGDFFRLVGYWIAQLLVIVGESFGVAIIVIIDTFVKAITGIAVVVDDIVKEVQALLSGDWQDAWDFALKSVGDFCDGVLTVLNNLIPGIKKQVDAIWDAIKSAMSLGANGWGKDLGAVISAGLQAMFPEIQGLKDAAKLIGGAFQGAAGKAKQNTAQAKAVQPAKAAAEAVKPVTIPPPVFNTGDLDKKIEDATKAYAKSIADLNLQVAKGLDDVNMPKATVTANALRAKIAQVTDTAKKAGVNVGAFAGQIGALQAQIQKLQTEGLQKEALAFAAQVTKDSDAVTEFARGGMPPLQDALAKVDDQYGNLKATIDQHIAENAELAKENGTAAAAMDKLKASLVSLDKAHQQATDSAKANYEAEKNIASLQAKGQVQEINTQITTAMQASGRGGTILTPEQEQLQTFQQQLAKQQIDAATNLATLQDQYAKAQQVGDTDKMANLQSEIDAEQKLKDVVDSTTAVQLDSASKLKSAFQSFTTDLSSTLDDLISNWNGDLSSLTNVFKKLASQLFLKPVTDQLSGGISGIIQGITKSIGLGGGGGGAAAAPFSGGEADVSDLFAGGFATGGTVPKGMWAIAGEKGPEPIFAGKSALSVMPHEAAVAAAGGGGRGTVQQTFNIGRMDKDTFRQTRRQFATTAKKALSPP